MEESQKKTFKGRDAINDTCLDFATLQAYPVNLQTQTKKMVFVWLLARHQTKKKKQRGGCDEVVWCDKEKEKEES